MNKKVLLTPIPYPFLPAKNGGQLAHVYFHNAMQDHMEDIVLSSVLNVFEHDEIKFKHIGLFNNRVFTYLPFWQARNFIKLIRKYKADYFMCSHPYLGAASILACALTKTKLISYSHNIESERFKSLNRWWWYLMFLYEKWVMQSSKVNFFVTPEDRAYGIKQYKLSENSCFVSPFGINVDEKPFRSSLHNAELKELYIIPEDHKVLYFVGSFGYQPNDKAVEDILNEVAPRLDKIGQKYTILIVGGGLKKELQDQIIQYNGSIKYLGFVKDLNPILLGADAMLNPMLLGGGIKTKVVEALGNDIRAVSTKNGANGMNLEVCKDMLFVSQDGDWENFAQNIVKACNANSSISIEFYQYYAWKNVTKNVFDTIEKYA